MKLPISNGSVSVDVDKESLVVLSKRPLRVLSSAVLNGGLVKADGIVSVHATEDCDEAIHKDPEEFLKKAVMKLGLDPEKVVGLITAADLRNVVVSSQKHQDTILSAFVTAGASCSATAGETTVSKGDSLKAAGTINIVLLADGDFTESCMVDAVKTITEAKTVALKELDIRSRFSGDLASGTITDGVVVACTKNGKPIEYAGTGTEIGELIGKSVKESVKKALQKQGKVVANRPLTERLRERGISLADLATLFSQTHPEMHEDAEKLRQFKEELHSALSEQNVASLVIAGLRLDEDEKMGLNPTDMCAKSQICETLQAAIVDYLDKKNTTPNCLKNDEPSQVVNKLGPYTRSIFAAIMNSAYSHIANSSSKI